MANSRGPSKVLYALGGWLLGGLIGAIAAPVVTLVLGSIMPVAGIVGLIIPVIGSIVGAVKGWNVAAHQQAIAAGAPVVVSTSTSRSMAEDVTPELTKEQALELAEAPHLAQEQASQSEQEQTSHSVQHDETPSYVKNFRPSVSKVETVQAERAEPQEAARY